MKIALRITIFLLGAALLFFGWHKAHMETLNLQNSGNTSAISSSEVLVVIGGFVALMAFLPSSKTLGRWMSLKRNKPRPPAHFRRRRRS
jgi:hypothetical protein